MVSSTPRPHFTPGEDPVSIVQEAGWAPEPIWTGGKSRPHRDSIPDRPAHSQSTWYSTFPVLLSFMISLLCQNQKLIFFILKDGLNLAKYVLETESALRRWSLLRRS